MMPVRARARLRSAACDEPWRRAAPSQSSRALPLACAAALAVSAACAAPATGQPDGPLFPLGCFADVVVDGEHEDGYSAQLWTSGSEVAGLVTVHTGLVGDAPLGVLDDVRYDASTGRISFTAKLTTGLHSCPIHDNVPSHDLLSFDGVLTATGLEGQVRTENRLDSPPRPGDFRRTSMRKNPACAIDSYTNREAWRRSWATLLAARGPKW